MMNYDQLLEAENSVSHLYEFVNSCLDLYEKKAEFGIYNIVNSGFITTSFVVQKIKEITGIKKEFTFLGSEKELYQIGAKAPRSNCILDNSKLINAGVKIRSAEEAIIDSIKNWKGKIDNDTSV
jgi:UDP-glucose 4,6-dehydratase